MLRGTGRLIPQSPLIIFQLFGGPVVWGSSVSRKIYRVEKNPELFDFTKNQEVQLYFEHIREQKSGKEGAPDLISNAIESNRKPSAPIFNPDKKKVNKFLRINLKKGVREAGAKFEEEMQLEFSKQSPHKISENIKNFYDWEALRKELYIRNEKKRLLFKEERNPENYLRPDLGPKPNENPFIVDHLKASISRQTQFLPQKELSVYAVPDYINYKNNKNSLVNQRIDNLLKGGNNSHNEKLAILMESGILDKSKNIKEVMSQSIKLIQKSKEQALGTSEPSVTLIEGKTESENKGNPEKMIQHYGASPEEISNEQKRWIVGRMVNAMDFELNEQEIRAGVNFTKIVEFFSLFLNDIREPDMWSLMEQLETLESLRHYEENLLKKHISTTPSLRASGRVTPEKLTESEVLSLLKHEKYNYTELLELSEAYPAVFYENPKIACQLHSKLTFEFENRKRFYKKYMMLDLFIIKSKAYKKLLGAILQALPSKMSFEETSYFIWNLSLLHAKEEGKLNPKLFEKLKETIRTKVNHFLSLESNYADPSPGFVTNLSLCASGLAELNWVGVEDQTTQIILDKISRLRDQQFEHTSNLHRLMTFTVGVLSQPRPLLPMHCPVTQAAAMVSKSIITAYSTTFSEFLHIEEWRNLLKGGFAIKKYFEETGQLWEQTPFFKKMILDTSSRLTGPILPELRSHDVGQVLTFLQDLQVYSEAIFFPVRSHLNNLMIKFDERFQLHGLPLASSALAYFELAKGYKSLMVQSDGSSKLSEVSLNMKELQRLRMIFKLNPFRSRSNYYRTFEKLFELCIGADKKKKVPQSFLIFLNSLALVNFRKFPETTYDFFKTIYSQYITDCADIDMRIASHIVQAASCLGLRMHIQDFGLQLLRCNSVLMLSLEVAVDCLIAFAVDPPKKTIPSYFLEKVLQLFKGRAHELRGSALVHAIWSLAVLMSSKKTRKSLISLGVGEAFGSLISALQMCNTAKLNHFDVYLINTVILSEILNQKTSEKLLEAIGGEARMLLDTQKTVSLLRHESERLEIDSGELTTEQMLAIFGQKKLDEPFVRSKILKTPLGGFIFPELYFPEKRLAVLMGFRQISERRQEGESEIQKELVRLLFEGGVERIMRRSMRKRGIRLVIGHKEVVDREGGIQVFVEKELGKK